MKTKKLIKALLGISFLTLGMVTINDVKEVNAAEVNNKYTWTAVKTDISSLSSTSSTANLDGRTWNVTRDNATYTNTSLQSGAIQIGSKASPETSMTLKTSDSRAVQSVSVDCASYNALHKVSITIGGTSYVDNVSTPKWSNNSTGTIEGTTLATPLTGDVEITFTKTGSGRALYLKSITIQYIDVAANYNVTFVSNCDTSVESKTVTGGSFVAEPTSLEKDGYTFGGWYTTETFEENTKWNFETKAVNENITLYAKWLDNDCDDVKNIESFMDLAYKYTVTEELATGYEKVTNVDQIVDGSKILIVGVEANGARHALSSSVGSASNTLTAYDVTVDENGYMAPYDETTIWTVSASGDAWTLSNGDVALYAQDGKTDLKTSSTGAAFSLSNNMYFGIGTRAILYNTSGYFKHYASSNIGGSSYASSMEIYIETESEATKNVYSGVEFRLKFGISKDITNTMNVLTNKNATFGLVISDGTTTEVATLNTETSRQDDTCYYVVVSLGDVINNIDRVDVKFSVKAFVISEGITYYSSVMKEFKVSEMVKTYYENGNSAVTGLYNIFVNKGVYPVEEESE